MKAKKKPDPLVCTERLLIGRPGEAGEHATGDSTNRSKVALCRQKSWLLQQRNRHHTSGWALYSYALDLTGAFVDHPAVFRMALEWTIDAEQRRVTIVAQGEVTRADFEELYIRLSSADAHAYGKLFDGILGHMRMSSEDLRILGARVRKLHAEGTMGPLAVLLTDSDSNLLAPLLGMLAAADRPMRIFRKLGAARSWIASQAKPVSS